MPELELMITSGARMGQVHALPGAQFTLGAAGDIRLEGKVELRHAEMFTSSDGALWLRNLAPDPAATLVNGREAPLIQIVPGAFLKLGDVELVLRIRGNVSGPHGTQQRRTPLTPTAQIGPPAAEPPTGVLVRGSVVATRYRVVEPIAAGGMGEIYRVEHIELGKPFALKMMRAEFVSSPDFVDRFKREALALARMGHPNIIDISDSGQSEDGRFFFVMEYLDGRTLADLIATRGAQPVEKVAQLGAQLCDALAAVHALDIVHRDLKPENVIILERPERPDLVKVLDFGIARVASGAGSGSQTAVGLVVGTPQYMSPEQASGMPSDARSDIYSLGLMLYEMVCGRPVFTGKTPSMLIAQHLRDPPPPMTPGPVALPVPRALEEIIFRMLAKKPEQRPQTMAEVKAALLEGAKATRVEPRRTQRLPNPTSAPVEVEPELTLPKAPMSRWVVALTVLAVLGVASVFALRSQSRSNVPVAVEEPVVTAPLIQAPPEPVVEAPSPRAELAKPVAAPVVEAPAPGVPAAARPKVKSKAKPAVDLKDLD